MAKKPAKCTECGKSSGFEGCSHMECPKRKPLTAQSPEAWDKDLSFRPIRWLKDGGTAKTPTNKE